MVNGWGWVRDARLRSSSSVTGMVNQSFILVFTVIRLFILVQVGLSVAFQVQHPPISPIAVGCAGLVAVFSLAWIVRLNLTGRWEAWPWGIADVLVGMTVLVACQLSLPSRWIIGTWLNWSVAYCGRVVSFAAAWSRTWKGPVLAGCGTAAVYGAIALPANGDQPVAILENMADYIFFSLGAWVFVTMIRRVARAADDNRLRAVELGTELELMRYRAHVHDATGLLARLSRPDTPTNLLPALQEQAAAESNRLRHEILQTRPASPKTSDGTIGLEAVVWDAASGFSHLPLEIAVGRGHGIILPDAQAEALRQALVALLYNVSFHAEASRVNVYADHGESHWEVVVSDDGAGFDPQQTEFGFGLATQAGTSLRSHDMQIEIDSQPASGTSITISGPISVSADSL